MQIAGMQALAGPSSHHILHALSRAAGQGPAGTCCLAGGQAMFPMGLLLGRKPAQYDINWVPCVFSRRSV